MAKIYPISGFPEWLPEQKLIENYIIDRIRENFELFGFSPIETRAIEAVEQLLKKGETDKEIYLLHRLQEQRRDKDSEWGLHFDLTVPFARYVSQFRGKLPFPMKRYQIQKVWRGERPQEGRYREFYQVDIDVIAEKELPLHYDVEIPRLLHWVVTALPFPPIVISINNRKVLEGFYQGLGVVDTQSVLRIVDKLEKVGEKCVSAMLLSECKLSEQQAEKCLQIAQISSSDCSFVDKVRALGVKNELLDIGLQELCFVMDNLTDLPKGSVIANLRIARGLDYYTGTVYEAVMTGFESLGSVCSGGRYDDLASSSSVKLPGVGISIGLTRILGSLFAKGLKANRKTPCCVLVALPSEELRMLAEQTANQLRLRGISTEVYHKAAKYGKQIRYAEKKGIPFVWFPKGDNTGSHELRDIRCGEQKPVDINNWSPPLQDKYMRVMLDEK